LKKNAFGLAYSIILQRTKRRAFQDRDTVLTLTIWLPIHQHNDSKAVGLSPKQLPSIQHISLIKRVSIIQWFCSSMSAPYKAIWHYCQTLNFVSSQIFYRASITWPAS